MFSEPSGSTAQLRELSLKRIGDRPCRGAVSASSELERVKSRRGEERCPSLIQIDSAGQRDIDRWSIGQFQEFGWILSGLPFLFRSEVRKSLAVCLDVPQCRRVLALSAAGGGGRERNI